MKQPQVACCIASYNMAAFLPELLDSLQNQTYKNITIYVSYHGSTDNVRELLKKYKSTKTVPYKKQPGIGLNKHDVVKRALQDKPKYILMFDADDYVLPTYVEKAVERLEKVDVDWVLVWGRLFGDRGGYIHSEIESLEELKKANNHRHSWISAKASLFKKMNYNPKITYAEDWDLWIRLDEAGYKGAIVEEELYRKRWHDGSLTMAQLGQQSIVQKTTKVKVMDSKRFVFHIPGYVHLPASLHYIGCAFTCKAIRLAKMLTELGHTVFYYGAKSEYGQNVDEYCNSSNLHFVKTHTVQDIAQQWGGGDNRFELGYDYMGGQFRHDFSDSNKTELTKKFYSTCITEINKRKKDNEFLLLMQGAYHKPISDAIKLYLTCEPGIGYRGSIKNCWRAFESSYLQNFTYGSHDPGKSIDGSYYDRVLPNYFDKNDFIFSAKKEDYYLYIGRMIIRKGVWTAVAATEAIGAKLILVGQKDDEIDVKKLPKHCEFMGFADIEKRKKLMSGAIATFVPTIYLEAFAGTHLESMLSGTPVITTNFGVFPGTIPDIIDGNFHMTDVKKSVGFKCNTLQDFVDAAKKAKEVDHKFIRKYAERFLMDNVKHEFQKWFRDLMNVYQSSVDDSKKGWSRLNSK